MLTAWQIGFRMDQESLILGNVSYMIRREVWRGIDDRRVFENGYGIIPLDETPIGTNGTDEV